MKPRRSFGWIFSCAAHAFLVPLTAPLLWADESVQGNLTVSGAGQFTEGVDLGASAQGSITWESNQVVSDINGAQGGFLWRDTYTVNNNVASSRQKMSLSTGNSLSLYMADGSTVGLSLDPSLGRITLPASAANPGIYLGSNALLKANSSGQMVFPSKVLFEDGADFGAGNTLNASNVGFLKGALTNLGYRENPVAVTPIMRIATSGRVNITKAFGTASHLYVLGSFDGNVSIGTVQLSDYGPGSAGFVAKCNPDGSVLWAKAISTTMGFVSPGAISVNAAGRIAVAGSFSGATSGFGPGKELVALPYTPADGFVAVYDASGNVQWTKSFGGAGYDSLTAVAIGGDGSVAIGGLFQSATTVPAALTAAGERDGAVIKFSSGGALIWSKIIGGTSDDMVNAVTIDSAGAVVASGYFVNAITTLGPFNRTSAGSGDGFLAKFDSATGAPIWLKAVGGTSGDMVSEHVIDSSGAVYAVGTFSGATTTLESGKNLAALGGQYDRDGFVIKTDSGGNTVWSGRLGGTGETSAQDVLLSGDGKVLVSGSFQGSTNSFGSGLNLTAFGGVNDTDIFLGQLDPATGAVIASQAVGGAGGDSYASIAMVPPSGVFLTSYSSVAFSLGDTRMVPDYYHAGWQGFSVLTPPPLATNSGFGWSGGMATGSGSTAIGNEAFASGSSSAAFGSGSATGDNAFASGSGVASGFGSIAMGPGARALAPAAIAIGDSSSAGGDNSLVIGTGSSTWGSGSVVVGNYNVASSTSGGMYVFGEYNFPNTTKYASYVIGTSNGYHGELGDYSFTIGAGSSALGTNSVALGVESVSYSFYSTALGTGNIGGGSATSWVETDPLFELGNKPYSSYEPIENRSNAITTLKNGQTTLTNKAWKADNLAAPTPENSQGKALVVEGHTELKGNTELNGDTVLKGKVTIDQPQGDISMGIYGGGQ